MVMPMSMPKLISISYNNETSVSRHPKAREASTSGVISPARAKLLDV